MAKKQISLIHEGIEVSHLFKYEELSDDERFNLVKKLSSKITVIDYTKACYAYIYSYESSTFRFFYQESINHEKTRYEFSYDGFTFTSNRYSENKSINNVTNFEVLLIVDIVTCYNKQKWNKHNENLHGFNFKTIFI